jgi:mRNA interferase RelE/StbE
VPGYGLVIPPRIADRIRRFPPDLKRGIREAMRAITEDPALGEPLRRELQGYHKYRVRRFRIVYRVDRRAKAIAIMAVGHRRSVYEDVAAAIRVRSEG